MSRIWWASVLLVCTAACGSPSNETSTPEASAGKAVTVEKPFVSSGRIDMQLDGGGYKVVAADGDRIRVTLSGNTGNATADVTANGSEGRVEVKDTPNNNFEARIEVPRMTDLVVRLKAGDLVVEGVTGNKDVKSGAGDLDVIVDDPDEYSKVEASNMAGDIDASAFGGSKSGLLQKFTWSGPGKYTLEATLGAGDLRLRR